MALDVNSSLASTLFTPAATSRPKTADQIGTTSSRPATLPGEKETSANFSSYIGEKTANATGKTPSRPATLPPRKLMPGQIVDHQDTKVGNPAETDASAKADTSQGAKVADAEQAQGEGAERKLVEDTKPRAGEEADRGTSEGRAEGPSAESNAAAQVGENAGEQGQSGQGAQGQGGADQGDSGSDAATAKDAEAVDAAANVVAAPVIVTISAAANAVVGAPVASADAGTAVAGESTTALGSATDGKTAGAPPTLPPEAGQPPVQGVEAASDEAAKAQTQPEGDKKQAATPATLPPAAAQPDTELQPGMREQVEARKAANAGAAPLKAGETSGIEASETKSSGKSAAAAAADALRPATHEGPTLRGAIFSQMLDGFAGAHGLNRASTVLASLDPNVAAQAQNNRAATELARPTPLQMLPIEIGMQAVRGAREFQIRLDPAELGRVDVKLHINDKGEVNASMIVERPETLQMLRRDATTLAQAFEQAGLKQGENALSFSLRGDGQQGQQQQQGGQGRTRDADDATLNTQVAEIAARRVMIPNSSLDLMV